MLDFLAVHWNMDPEIIRIGAYSLRWYGLLFISGFVLGWFIFKWFFKREDLPESLLDPLLYTLLIGTIIGSRLGIASSTSLIIISAAGMALSKYSCHGRAVLQVMEELSRSLLQ